MREGWLMRGALYSIGNFSSFIHFHRNNDRYLLIGMDLQCRLACLVLHAS